MIRINLMKSFSTAASGPESFVSGGGGSRDELILEAAKRALIIFLGPLALYVYELNAIPVLQTKLRTIEAEMAEVTAFNESKSGLAAEIKKYEEEQAKINAQMGFINKIARDKINEFKLFQHLQNATPDSVWINRIEFKDNVLTINTESDVSEDLNQFSVRLSNTEFLTNIVPTDQSVKVDPFGLGINTTTQNLKAQFNGESSQP